jgi:DNA-3-methyladenine glycosylase
MGKAQLDRSWLEHDTIEVAKRLIGCHLVRRTPQGDIRIQLTETEAYKGPDDPASHAFRGRTPRNILMFGEVGRLYVYFIYGMHYCLNIVAHEPGDVGAVLLRGGRAVEGIEIIRANRPGVPDRNLLNGPGKLVHALGMNGSYNGYDLFQHENQEVMLKLDGAKDSILQTPRIGISKGTDLPWRFILAGNNGLQGD